MSKIDLTWGESVAVRNEFVSSADIDASLFSGRDLLNLNYSPFEGDSKLLDYTREVIFRQVGRKYKHVILTNGAAGGCTITLRAYYAQGRTIGITPTPPFFSLYPSMVKASGLRHEWDSIWFHASDQAVYMFDSPSNPEGIIRNHKLLMPVIWDAVYGNKVYTKNLPIPAHDVLVGSYSKLTGLNGIRIGWIATDDSLLFERIKVLVAAEYCGLSVPSMMILNQIVPNYNWDAFHTRANNALDNNRTEWQKLEKFFDGKYVSPNGMFYYGPMDDKCKQLFEKANVVWTPSSRLGAKNDKFGRFNIGQDLELVKRAVAQVLQADKI